MDDATLAAYLQELGAQCDFARTALEIFNQSGQQSAHGGVLFAAQAAVTATGQVAALLWPARARARRRGEALREVLGLPEKHPFNDRRFSELLDHSDDQVDRWLSQHRTGRAVFDVVTPVDQIAIPGLTEADLYRVVDPKTGVFYYRGVGYNLDALAKTLGDVRRRVSQAAADLERRSPRHMGDGAGPGAASG